MKKIQIVFIHNQLVCGGAEQALFDLICLLDQERFDVSVLVQYEGGAWENKFADAGIRVVHYFQKREKSKSFFYFIQHQVKKIRIKCALKLDGRGLVDILFPNADIIVDYSTWEKSHMAFSKNAKSVKYVHGDLSDNMGFRNCIFPILNLLPRYDRIVCVSRKACEAFKKITGVSQNVEYHFNPLNSENVRFLAEKGIDMSFTEPMICAVGRLASEKGYDRLIRIHRRILDQGIPHKLVIIGDGPERENLEKIVEETKAKNSALLCGYQSNPYPYMKKCTFLVCSSFTEGLPVIATEALSLGIPIVSSAPSIAEVFGDELCGIITEQDDDSLEKGIKRMLIDYEFYENAKQGAQRRQAFFDGKRMVKDIEKMFAELVGE